MITVTKTEYKMTFTSQVRMEQGVYVWVSNGRVPPADAIKAYGIDKLPGYDHDMHEQARDEQVNTALAEYRKAMENYVPSAEEAYEMMAAFGPKATVVNVVTGQVIKYA